MKVYYFFLRFFILLFVNICLSQQTVTGNITNENKQFPISNATVINLNKVSAVISSVSGNFEIEAELNDIILVYFLGYEPIRVRVTNDWIKNKNNEIQLSELVESVDRVLIQDKLTGIISLDIANKKKNNNLIVSISGLNHSGYELRGSFYDYNSLNLDTKDLYLRKLLNKKKEVQSIKKIRKNPELTDALKNSFRRELACSFLNISKEHLKIVLKRCRFSDYYILYASDLQVLEGIKDCYENLKSLQQ